MHSKIKYKSRIMTLEPSYNKNNKRILISLSNFKQLKEVGVKCHSKVLHFTFCFGIDTDISAACEILYSNLEEFMKTNVFKIN